MRRYRGGLAAAVLLLLVGLSRGAVLLGSPAITDHEESYVASAAAELAGPNRAPLQAYQYTHYEGGTLLGVLLTAPLVWLAGTSFWVVKAPALLLGLLLAWLGYLYLRQVSDRRTALFGLAAWVLAPPYLVQVSLLNWGCYQEVAVLGLLLMLLCEKARDRTEPDGPGWWFGVGLLCGLGLWVHYAFALALAACAPVLLPRLRLAGLAAALVGGALGLSPWLAYNVAHDWIGLRRLAEGAPGESAGAAVEATLRRLWELPTRHLPRSYHMPGAVSAWSLHLIALIALGSLAARRSQRPRPLVLWFVAAYALAFAASRYTGAEQTAFRWGELSTQSHVHMLPLLPVWVLVVALGLSALAGAWPRLAGLLAVAWLALGAHGAVHLFRPLDAPRAQYADARLSPMLAWSSGLKAGQADRGVRPGPHVDAGDAPFHTFGYGAGCWSQVVAGRLDRAAAARRRAELPPGRRPFFDMGRGLVEAIWRRREPAHLRGLADRLRPARRAPFAAGCALAGIKLHGQTLGGAMSDMGLEAGRLPSPLLRFLRVCQLLVTNDSRIEMLRQLWPESSVPRRAGGLVEDLWIAFRADDQELVGLLVAGLREAPRFPQRAVLAALADERRATLVPILAGLLARRGTRAAVAPLIDRLADSGGPDGLAVDRALMALTGRPAGLPALEYPPESWDERVAAWRRLVGGGRPEERR